jgi:hypothetical protein
VNRSGLTEFGIGPAQASLECDYASPDARWTAPIAGFYCINIQIGGSTAQDTAGSGNASVGSAGVTMNGVNQLPASFVNNVQTWIFNYIYLHAGDTIDAFVAQSYGSGNTQTFFTVRAVPQLDLSMALKNVVLRWPTNASGWTLHANSNLNSTIWTSVALSSQIVGTNFTLTMPATNKLQFFRLEHP